MKKYQKVNFWCFKIFHREFLIFFAIFLSSNDHQERVYPAASLILFVKIRLSPTVHFYSIFLPRFHGELDLLLLRYIFPLLTTFFFYSPLKLSMKNDFELYLISCAHIYSHPSHPACHSLLFTIWWHVVMNWKILPFLLNFITEAKNIELYLFVIYLCMLKITCWWMFFICWINFAWMKLRCKYWVGFKQYLRGFYLNLNLKNVESFIIMF